MSTYIWQHILRDIIAFTYFSFHNLIYIFLFTYFRLHNLIYLTCFTLFCLHKIVCLYYTSVFPFFLSLLSIDKRAHAWQRAFPALFVRSSPLCFFILPCPKESDQCNSVFDSVHLLISSRFFLHSCTLFLHFSIYSCNRFK